MKKFLNMAYWIVLVFYSYLLVDTVFLARDVRRSINIVPFDMIFEQGFTINVWGNVLMFIPLGVYFADNMKQFRFWKVLGGIIGTSLAIEVLQYIFKCGASDIDDIILNTIGGLLGIFIYLLLKSISKSKEQVHIAISILSIIVGVPVILLVIIIFAYNH